MTADEVGMVLTVIAGNWAHPAMTQEESVAWAARIRNYDADSVLLAIEDLVSLGSHWRPTPAQFLAAHRSAMNRQFTPVRALPSPPPAKEVGAAGIAAARAALAGVTTTKEIRK